ncbi:hypothetical protein D3C86_1371110 [compost metagenome]
MLIDGIKRDVDAFTDFGVVLQDQDAVAGPALVVPQGVIGRRGGIDCRFRFVAGPGIHHDAIRDRPHRFGILWRPRRHQVNAAMPAKLMADRKRTLAGFFTQAPVGIAFRVFGLQHGA